MITNAGTWNDTAGSRLEAHGAGLLAVTQHRRFYWFGETAKVADFASHGVSCYSSADLVGWRYEALSLHSSAVRGLNGERAPEGWVIERPKVLYSQQARLYTMWFHLEGPTKLPLSSWATYNLHAAGVATSTTPCGPYTFLRAVRPAGMHGYDASLFQDDDGRAYRVQDVQHEKCVAPGPRPMNLCHAPKISRS